MPIDVLFDTVTDVTLLVVNVAVPLGTVGAEDQLAPFVHSLPVPGQTASLLPHQSWRMAPRCENFP